jgi:hypothetical protein
MEATYTVSPTNFKIVNERVAKGLNIAVGKDGIFSNGITLTPRDLSTDYQKYVQIGLTLPQGALESLTLNYACSGHSFITQINLIEATSAGNSRILWYTQNALTGSGQFSPTINSAFNGSLDFTVGVVFREMSESIKIGSLSFKVG